MQDRIVGNSPIVETEPFGTYRLSWPLAQTRRALIANGTPRPFKWLAGKTLGLHREMTRGCYDVVYQNLKLRLFVKENLSDNLIFRHGRHHEEEDFLRFFDRVRSKNLIFVDIGANIGLYTLLAFRALTAHARIIAFEPHPRTRSKLIFNLTANGARKSVQVIGAGVANCAGTLSLRIGESAGAASMLKQHGDDCQRICIDVPVVILPDQLEEIGIYRPDIIKIDVEGYEDKALKPLFETWPPERWPRFLLIEIEHRSYWQWDCVAELNARGYRTIFQTKNNLHLCRD